MHAAHLSRQAHEAAVTFDDRALAETYRARVGIYLTNANQYADALLWLEGSLERLAALDRPIAAAARALGVALLGCQNPADSIAPLRAAVAASRIERDWPCLLDSLRLLCAALHATGRVGETGNLLVEAQENAWLMGDRAAWTAIRPMATAAGVIDSGRIWDPLKIASESIDLAMEAFHSGGAERASRVLGHTEILIERGGLLNLVRTSTVFLLATGYQGIGDDASAIRLLEAHDAYRISRRTPFVDRAHDVLIATTLAQLWGKVGVSQRSEDWVAETEVRLVKLKNTRERLQAQYTLATTIGGEEGRRRMSDLLGQCTHPRLIDVRCSILTRLAPLEPDKVMRRRLLDEAESLLPQISRAFRADLTKSFPRTMRKGARINLRQNPDFFEGAVEGLRQQIQLIRALLLSIDDGDNTAREALDDPRFDARVMGRDVAPGIFVARARFGDAKTLEACRDAVPVIAARIEGMASLGFREQTFEEFKDQWRLALSTLLASEQRQDWHLAVGLMDVANRGSMRAFRGRGASAARQLDAPSVSSAVDRIKDAATALGSSSREWTIPFELLRDRLCVKFAPLRDEPGRLTLGRVVCDSTGPLERTIVELTSSQVELLTKLGARLGTGMTAGDGDWIALSQSLLGSSLAVKSHLNRFDAPDLLVVPGHPLVSAVPWAGIRLGDDVLAQRAASQVLPSIGMLQLHDRRPPELRALLYTVPLNAAYANATALDLQTEIDALDRQTTWSTTAAADAKDLTKLLNGTVDWAIAYVATHGEGHGADGGLLHGDGSLLGVSDALDLNWARCVVMSSCSVTRADASAGSDPIGLPLAMLLRGADHVVGCSQNVGVSGSRFIGSRIIDSLSYHETPTRAVQLGQIAWLERRGGWQSTGLLNWAPYQVISLC
jgi:hypothetical protein